MRNVVKNIYLLLIDNAIVPHVALQLSIAITLRDARLITIAPTFIGATIRRVLITIYIYKAGTSNGRRYVAYAKYRRNTCEVCGCGGIGTRLVVHHRDGNCTNNVPGNLITLCDSCHKLVHSGKIILEKV